jgi:LacI family kdg operon repressor
MKSSSRSVAASAPAASKPEGRATIADVASLAGVSKATVSRFLNHRDTRLSPEIATRVEKAVAALAYQPSPMAQALKRGRTRLIGLVVADITNPFSVAVLRGAEQAAQQAGYLVMLFNLGNVAEREREGIEALAAYQVEGFILNTQDGDASASGELIRHGKPVVLVDRKHSHMAADFVALDNDDAVRQVVSHLVDNGWRDLLYVSQPVLGVSSRVERMAAFVSVVATHAGCTCQILEGAEGAEEQLDDALRALKQRAAGRPVAVVAGNALVTLRVAAAVVRLGWRFGHDLGFVGFDDTVWAPLVGPGLTTIEQPTHEIGQMAATCLLDRLAGREAEPRQIRLTGRLVPRASSARAPG